ncbi:asparagine synthase (glutamine-hydrolyzing) [Paenibacillus aquistagni]|uniref:asparagine synthase (glutamine-hydrolyzing) n=1 Tax=Paenibacillus aquistagni TaxID=1852522 RepID=UPI000B509E42|nr:asparagine synthase (glutamine-hydrolyzing) [Paenibacillus aquistagni]NMM55483.1 asparagine synthase (glutamine-hydrolyzing) [Paenibacillus aquistagni]
MCGICGSLDYKGYAADSEIIQSMSKRLEHRGPDNYGFFIHENVGLGIKRLSVVDLNGGNQPLFNETRTVVLVCNGEIFNHKELRQFLIEKGHRFSSNVDVEVIIHLYEQYGFDFLNKLNGQFAFALYDLEKRQLFCARDQMGIVPFFYTVWKDKFLFASEIKALLEYPGISKEVNVLALDQIMHFPGYVSPETMFKGIYNLAAGHYLYVGSKAEYCIKQYWDLNFQQDMQHYSEDYYIGRLDELLQQSVAYRLQADVPVGLYISGGLDSSIIASKAAHLCPGTHFNTYSIDFESRDISEKKYQNVVTNHIQSIHHEKKITSDDIASLLEKVVYHSESPLKETYNTASFLLSSMVNNNGQKVILTGEGADELFAGYVGYRFDKFRRLNPMQEVSPTEEEVRRKLWGDSRFMYERDHSKWNETCAALYSSSLQEALVNKNALNSTCINLDKMHDLDDLQRRSYIDFKIRLADHLLSDHGDRMAYANSVEARYPFLDINVVEFACSIPSDLKLKNFTEKYILKQSARSQVPQQIIKRQKFAFVAPGSPDLLRLNREFVLDILSYETIKRQGFFNADQVEQLKKNYLKDGFKLNLPFENDQLIILLTFGLFLKTFGIT